MCCTDIKNTYKHFYVLYADFIETADAAYTNISI